MLHSSFSASPFHLLLRSDVIREQRNADLVRAFVAAVNAQAWERLDELVAPGFVRHSAAAGDVTGRRELVSYLRQEYVTFPDAVERIEDCVAEGDRVACRVSFSGTQTGPLGQHPPTGRPLAATYLAIYRLANDRIAEAWVEWDNLDSQRQLGLLPGSR